MAHSATSFSKIYLFEREERERESTYVHAHEGENLKQILPGAQSLTHDPWNHDLSQNQKYRCSTDWTTQKPLATSFSDHFNTCVYDGG